jgi:glutamyl-tRNA synthetase
VLRVEDLDGPRTVPAAVAGNLAELRWLGLDWDEGPDVGGPHAPYLQSERGERYLAALERLASDGRLAEDWLSRRDLREAASAPHGPAGPVYGTAERRLSARWAEARRREGRTPAQRARFGPEDGEVEAHDRRHGLRRFDLASDVGDVVVRRSDGLWAYALAVVVDDAAMGITEVVRGDDLLEATGAQVALARALGLPSPTYAHVPLLQDADGARMAKRRGGATLAELRTGGIDPGRVVGALAATLGWLASPRPLTPEAALRECDTASWPDRPTRWTPELDAWVRRP